MVFLGYGFISVARIDLDNFDARTVLWLEISRIDWHCLRYLNLLACWRNIERLRFDGDFDVHIIIVINIKLFRY